MTKTLFASLTVFLLVWSSNPGGFFPAPLNPDKYTLNTLGSESGKFNFNPGDEETNYRIKTIVIDAGHGGRDRGCSGKNSREKDIVLKVAKLLGKKINANYPEVNLIYTRQTDRFIALHKRASLANQNKADLFISLHCNAIRNADYIKGSETYVMGLHTAKENLAVAKRENASILMEENYQKNYDGFDPNSPEGHIILSMYQNAFLEQSILLAEKIEAQFKITARRKSRGVKQAGFVVLRQTAMPSVLVELGYLTNAHDEAYLLSAKGQAKMAQAIFEAFRSYKFSMEEDQNKVLAAHPSAPVVPPKPVVKAKPNNNHQYKVQLSSLRKPTNLFTGKWLKVDYILEEAFESGRYRYFATGFYDLQSAQKAKAILRRQGFHDAFIVFYKNGIRTPFKESDHRAKGY